jgi:hypothetical protein
MPWEAADLRPVLIESIERQYLRLDPALRSAPLDASAATIDRLRPAREATGRGAGGVGEIGSKIKQSVPVRPVPTWASRRREADW